VDPDCFLHSKIAQFTKARITFRTFQRCLAEYDVVEHFNLQQLTRPDQVARNFDGIG
jgi:hypothetical protein